MIIFKNRLCFLFVGSMRSDKTARDGYHAYHGYQTHRLLADGGDGALYRKGKFVSPTAYKGKKATMATMDTKWFRNL